MQTDYYNKTHTDFSADAHDLYAPEKNSCYYLQILI